MKIPFVDAEKEHPNEHLNWQSEWISPQTLLLETHHPNSAACLFSKKTDNTTRKKQSDSQQMRNKSFNCCNRPVIRLSLEIKRGKKKWRKKKPWEFFVQVYWEIKQT